MRDRESRPTTAGQRVLYLNTFRAVKSGGHCRSRMIRPRRDSEQWVWDEIRFVFLNSWTFQ